MLPEHFEDRNVCILGLGYVGLTLAVAMAEAGFQVHGLEVREDVLDGIRKGEPHFWELGLKRKLRQAIDEKRITFSSGLDKSVKASVYIITVGTPLGPDGKARLDMVANAARQVSAHYDDGALVILRSTVKLGTARNVISPVLQNAGKAFGIAVCPERTLEGRALIELGELPQIIGADDAKTSMRAAQLFNVLTPTVIRVKSLETAEMIKLVDNTYRDVSFAFGNEIARICDGVGISANEVIRGGKLGYSRTNVAMPGPVGGPCLEKNPHILAESARAYGVEIDITLASRKINERQPSEVCDFLEKTAKELRFPERPLISLLGIAFKGNPPTDDLRGTMARPIFDELKKRFPKAQFRGYDAQVSASEMKTFGLEPHASLDDALRDCSLAIILNNHTVFATMTLEEKVNLMARPSLVYDFWNLFSGRDTNLPEGTHYAALGSHGLLKLRKAGA